MNQYECADCHIAVIVIGEEIIKACTCDAPIIANASATVAGVGGVTNGNNK